MGQLSTDFPHLLCTPALASDNKDAARLTRVGAINEHRELGVRLPQGKSVQIYTSVDGELTSLKLCAGSAINIWRCAYSDRTRFL